MIFIEQVREGLAIVGSNGVHVGSVDALSGTLLKLNPSSRSQALHPGAFAIISMSGWSSRMKAIGRSCWFRR